jgi:hypothetical protein
MDAAVELQGCIHRVFCHLDPDISRNAAGNQLLRWLSFGGNQEEFNVAGPSASISKCRLGLAPALLRTGS